MDKINFWTSAIVESLSVFGQKVMGIVPSLIGAIVVLLIGWFIARLSKAVVLRILNKTKFERVSEKLNLSSYLQKGSVNLTASQMIAKMVYWVVLLLFIIASTEILGWKVISTEMSLLLAYLPKLVSALIVFLFGMLIIAFIRDAIVSAGIRANLKNSRFIAGIAYYIFVFILVVTVMDQAEINTIVLTNNMLLIFGALLLSFSVAYGWAARYKLGNLIVKYMIGSHFETGQEIIISGSRGIITGISNNYVTIDNNGQKELLPIMSLVNKEIIVINQP